MAPKIAGAVSAAQHPDLHRHLFHFKGVASAGGEKGRGGGKGHVGCSEVRERGQGTCMGKNFCSPKFLDLFLDPRFPLSLGGWGGKDRRWVGQVVLEAEVAHLDEPWNS